MNAHPSQGFVFCAFTKSYLEEAAGAITWLLRHNPGAKVCLVTTEELKAYYERADAHQPLDRIVCMPLAPDEPLCFFRTKLYELSPYDRTIALDADTYPVADLRDLFDLLETFDFIAVPDEARPARGVILGLKGGYAALGYYNAGVLLFRKSPATRQLFDAWRQEYTDLAPLEPADQGPLVRALVKTPVRFITLPREYNLRLFNKCASFQGRAKIIHARARHPDQLIRMVNNITLVNRGSRVWLPGLQRVVPATAWYPVGRLLALLNREAVQVSAVGKRARTSVARNVRQAAQAAWRRLRQRAAGARDGREGRHSAVAPELSVLDHVIRTYAIRSFLGVGRGAEAYAAYCRGQAIETCHMAPERGASPGHADGAFELVWCEAQAQAIKPQRLPQLIDTLTQRAARFLVLTYPRSGNEGSAARDFQEDWSWVQLITDRGFYFDPHLTLALRRMAQHPEFQRAGLVFERTRPLHGSSNGHA